VGDFSTRRCNKSGVDLEPLVLSEDVELVRGLIQRHIDLTGSPRAAWILGHWETTQAQFIKVFPHEYKRVLGVPRAESDYVSPVYNIPPKKASPLVATGQVQHG
jgi:glutamate synthase domain-containing protein 3